MIHRVALRTGSRDLAEEVVQVALLKALEGLDGLKDPRRLKGVLARLSTQPAGPVPALVTAGPFGAGRKSARFTGRRNRARTELWLCLTIIAHSATGLRPIIRSGGSARRLTAKIGSKMGAEPQ